MVAVGFPYLSCLVKEDKDAVCNSLAGDAYPVMKEIPEFPPRHPHFHPVHMLHKIFSKKNCKRYFTVSFSWIADSAEISVLLKFALFAIPSKESEKVHWDLIAFDHRMSGRWSLKDFVAVNPLMNVC